MSGVSGSKGRAIMMLAGIAGVFCLACCERPAEPPRATADRPATPAAASATGQAPVRPSGRRHGISEVADARREHETPPHEIGLPRAAEVLRVIDGDTLKLAGGERVRLIGVDTPETVHPRKPVEFFGKEASAFTRRHLEGERIILRYEQANAATRHREAVLARAVGFSVRRAVSS